MHQPVDQGRCQGVVHIKEFAPFPEGTIRGDHDRSNFITGGDNLEQQIGPMLVDGQIVQLIEDGTGTQVLTRHHQYTNWTALASVLRPWCYRARLQSQFRARRESHSRLGRPRRRGGRARPTCSARDVVALSTLYISMFRSGVSPAGSGLRMRRLMSTVVGWATARSCVAG